MALRGIPPSKQTSIEDRRSLKPEPRDIIRFGNVEYVAIAVGSKYVRAYELIGGSPNFPRAIRMDQIVKTGKRIDSPAQA